MRAIQFRNLFDDHINMCRVVPCHVMPCHAGGLSTLVQIETFGVVCTSAGFLILSKNHSLSAIHIATGAVEPIDSAVVNRLKWPRDLALSDTDRTLYVALNASFQITAVSLPDAYFTADSTQ